METPSLPVRETWAGNVLIASVVLGLLMIVNHPTGHQLVHADDRGAAILRDQLVHALAIGVIVLQTCGALGIVRRTRRATVGPAELAMVCQFCAAFAGVVAAVASGFLASALLDRATSAPPPEDLWRYTSLINRSFARVLVIAGSAAIAIWSLAGWRGALPRGLCWFGGVGSVLAMALLVVGHLRLDVHGFGAVLLLQGVWFVGVGRALRRGSSPVV